MIESKLWRDVNALGGVPTNEYERGFSEAISQALDLIEKSGHIEMLEALKAITTALRDGYSPNRQKLEAAEAAIAKATGGDHA